MAKASTTRTKANRAFQGSLIFRVGDATTFNAWFAAYIARDRDAARVAVRRFRPEYKVAFDAWIATHPFTNRNAPKGPQFMPQYKPTGEAESKALDATADVYFEKGQKAAETGDRYVRTTVVLASVLFLIGIGSHFPLRGVRYGLIGVGAALLAVAAVLIVLLPPPP